MDILNISEQYTQAGTRVTLDFNITAEINYFINYAWPTCICSLSNDTGQQPLEELKTFFKYCREDTVHGVPQYIVLATVPDTEIML